MTYSHQTNMLNKHAFLYVATNVRCQSTYCWIPHFANTLYMPESKSDIRAKIESFWDGALKEIEEDTKKYEYPVKYRLEDCVNPDTRTIKVNTLQNKEHIEHLLIVLTENRVPFRWQRQWNKHIIKKYPKEEEENQFQWIAVTLAFFVVIGSFDIWDFDIQLEWYFTLRLFLTIAPCDAGDSTSSSLDQFQNHILRFIEKYWFLFSCGFGVILVGFCIRLFRLYQKGVIEQHFKYVQSVMEFNREKEETIYCSKFSGSLKGIVMEFSQKEKEGSPKGASDMEKEEKEGSPKGASDMEKDIKRIRDPPG